MAKNGMAKGKAASPEGAASFFALANFGGPIKQQTPQNGP